MSALDEVAKLKAARRAELAAAEEARIRAEEAAEQERIRALQEAVDGVLIGLECDWLGAFRAGELPRIGPGSDRVEVRFDVPGHRPIFVRLTKRGGEWQLVPEYVSGTSPWCVSENDTHTSLTGADHLADALIVAEIPGWEPPPAEPTPAAVHAAQRAWAAMNQADNPLPPGPALDMVQEETGGVRAAALDLLIERALELLTERPVTAGYGFMAASGVLLDYLDSRKWAAVAAEARDLHRIIAIDRGRMGGFSPKISPTSFDLWESWVRLAERTNELCCALAAEATS